MCYSNDIMDDITLAKRLFVRQYCHSCSYNCIGKVFLSSFCTSYFKHYGQNIQYLSINYVSFLAHKYQSFKFFVCIFCLSSNFWPKLVKKMFPILKHWFFFETFFSKRMKHFFLQHFSKFFSTMFWRIQVSKANFLIQFTLNI